MARFTRLLADGLFAAGVIYYLDTYPGDSNPPARIVIQVRIAGEFVPFLVDTGAPWCVLNPRIAQPLIDSGHAEQQNEGTYIIRGYKYNGIFFRLDLVLEDEAGNYIAVDATVFVPTLQFDEEWTHPNFLGLVGFLDRIRFAVDPQENAFYFGAD